MREFVACRSFIFLPLLGQTFDAEEFGAGIGVRPVAEEDVVFVVQRGDVGDAVAEIGDCVAYFGCQGCGGEDGYGAALQADCC